MIIDFYLYIFIFVIWIVYVLNSFYQNRRMKRYLPNSTIEVLTIPFYIFTIVAFFILSKNTITIFFGNKENINFISSLPESFLIITIVGIVFCIVSIVLFTYVNFLEKNFPSCLAIKKGQQLGGIYKYIRHPSYYIFFLITFGTAFCLSSILLFVLACVNHISLYFYYMIEENQIKKENHYYGVYLKKTKRFFPRFSKIES